MDTKKFSAFKYAHPGGTSISTRRLRVVQAVVAIAVVAGIAFFPAGFLALLIPLAIYLSTPKMLYVGPRYLICGQRIVYFGNVSAITLDESGGRLRLESVSGSPFLLERDKFPSNARKSDKIAANKAKKFEKVSARVIEMIVKISPEVARDGIKHSG